MTTKWFPRFGDVPGVDYSPPVALKRDSLPGYDARPTINHYEFSGRSHESLCWPSKGGATSQSPAGQHHTASSGKELSSKDLLWRLEEVLELPGVLTDYHFAIQTCAEELWDRRRSEPDVLSEVERLCWLDINLIEAHPDLLKEIGGEKNPFPTILGFGHLIRLYSREGHLREALGVAKRAARFGQQTDWDSLQQRIATLEAEERL